VPSIGISGRVLIVGGKRPETRGIQQRLEAVLSRCACTVISVTLLDDIEDHDIDGLESAVVLADLDEPIFQALTARGLAKLQGIFSPNRYVLWLTNGFRGQTPYHSASIGLGRTLKGETPQLKLQFLDLDTLSDVQDLVIETFLRLAFVSKNDIGATLWTTESEIVLSDGDIVLPRIFPIPTLNDRLNSIRRVITKHVDTKASAVELVPLDERGSMTYQANDSGLNPKTLCQAAAEDSVVVQMLYSSAWALDVVPGKAHMFIGVGISSEGAMVLLATPRNSSWVSLPRRWTKEIGHEHSGADAVTAGLMVRAILAQRLAESADPRPLAVLGADPAFLSYMNVVRSSSQQSRDVFYLTTSQDRWEEDGSFIFVHPQSTRRVANAAVPVDLGALIDLTAGSASPIAELLRSATRICPESSLVRRCGSTETKEGLDSAVEATLLTAYEHVDKLRSSVPHLSYVTETTVRAVADIVGDGSQPYFTVLDWTETTKSTVMLERIRPIDLTTVLSPEKTYVLVGLTGDMGESLCRLMASHGARYFIVASR
jgi:pseurotin A synthetase (hybrid polyketide synthase/nonribosomal peptide synthetase)